MKALSLHQPWASLVALGVKTIETRSWSTNYRGPLAIHATKRAPQQDKRFGPSWKASDRVTVAGTCFKHEDDWIVTPSFPAVGHVWLPLGAVIATCTLADVAPIVEWTQDRETMPLRPWVAEGEGGCLVYEGIALGSGRDVTDQRPYGDFTPGRFAWLLEDIVQTAARCPAGCRVIALGDEDDFDAEAGGYRIMTGSTPVGGGTLETWDTCPTCFGKGSSEAIPARGHQGLWNWEAT